MPCNALYRIRGQGANDIAKPIYYLLQSSKPFVTEARDSEFFQIAKRLNESGRAYETDLAEILEKQKQLWGLANRILMKLSAIQ